MFQMLRIWTPAARLPTSHRLQANNQQTCWSCEQQGHISADCQKENDQGAATLGNHLSPPVACPQSSEEIVVASVRSDSVIMEKVGDAHIKTKRSVMHSTSHADGALYISLAYLIYFRMIKFYLLPMLIECGRGSFFLQSPVTDQVEMDQCMSLECQTSLYSF